MEFEGKTALVTGKEEKILCCKYRRVFISISGSTSGIGEGIAVSFAKNGAKVVVTGRDKARLDVVVNACNKASPSGHKALGIIAELTKDEDMKRIIDETVKHFGKLDVLVNNAGRTLFSSVEDANLMKTFDMMYATNLRPFIYMSNLAIPHLVKTKGCIVNISSTSAIKPEREMLPTNVIDSGKDMVTRTFALELGPKGVRVNSVRPGWIKTPAYEKEGLVFEQMEGLKKQPIKKHGDPSDVAHCVLFLASPRSAFITGACLQTDGGLSDA
ncbi:dehydrogenase/reductase-like protein [Leptotrombidium deliense]|uniref:Dehydrogenase/reductase-like protein n=1 Tax=Leptotrombidium deliense TaxID=299467 RepID=A0A443S515_9ACAR|nr:dehydrogenase/reductase-like protein [Leptotrombidium deliense]